jgi:hypothetical protein
MIDIGLPGYLLVALLDLLGGVLVLATQLLIRIARLCQLDLDVAQRVLQLLVFNLGQTKHLSALFLSAFVTLYSKSLAMSECGDGWLVKIRLYEYEEMR